MWNNKLHTDQRYREISGEFKHYLTLGQFNPRRSAQFSFLNMTPTHFDMPLRLYLMCLTNAEFYRESAHTILSSKNGGHIYFLCASNRLTFTMLTIYWCYHKTWEEDAAIKIMPQISMFILRLGHFSGVNTLSDSFKLFTCTEIWKQSVVIFVSSNHVIKRNEIQFP